MSESPSEQASIEASIDEMAGYMEGQQHLLDFLFELLALNTSLAQQREIRRELLALIAHYGKGQPEARPAERVLQKFAVPRPRFRVLRGGKPPGPGSRRS